MNLPKPILLCIALAMLVLNSGCSRYSMSDDIDLDFNWSLTVSDAMHLPYVAGANVVISLHDAQEDDDFSARQAERAAWQYTSSRPEVLRIESKHDGRATCFATGPGRSLVSVHDGEGELLHETEIEVRAPTRIELRPHGLLLVERNVVDSDPKILSGGTATFLVRYFDGDERLFGNGSLTATTDGDDDLEPLETFLFENREWLQIVARGFDTETIQLWANGEPISKVTVTSMAASDVDSISLVHGPLPNDEADAEGQHDGLVLAQARDEHGNAIYGVEVSFDLDGDGEPGQGDLFRYRHDPAVTSVLGAEFDGLRAETTIHSSEGFVDSSNDVGCSVGNGKPGSTAWLILAACGLSAVRRRRLAA